MTFDTTGPADDYYSFEQSHEGADPSSITEWLIPWDSIFIDSSDHYEVGIVASDNCGKTCNPLVLSGKRSNETKNGIFTRKVNMQIITIVILLFLFLRLRARAKKLNNRRNR